VGNTESMKQKRPELVGMTQVSQAAKETRFACYRKGVFVDSKIRIKPLETVGVVRDCALTRS